MKTPTPLTESEKAVLCSTIRTALSAEASELLSKHFLNQLGMLGKCGKGSIGLAEEIYG